MERTIARPDRSPMLRTLSHWCVRIVCIVCLLSSVFAFIGITHPTTLTGQPARAFTAFNQGQTPPMGWNPYNYWYLHQSDGPCCNFNEAWVKSNVDALVSSGMLAAGYQYVNLDAGWDNGRDSNGEIQPDYNKFPDGMQGLANYVHSKCVTGTSGQQICAKFGLYFVPDNSRYNEQKDANTFARWGVDYLKYDYFFRNGAGSAEEQYGAMSNAIKNNSYGRPMIFSMNAADVPWVSDGRLSPWRTYTAHSWRTTADIFNGNNNWSSIRDILNQTNQSSYDAATFAGPGRWNDPDMLEVGNGMNETEERSHFSMWAIMAAPLIAGTNLASMSQSAKTTYTNSEVIAIDQDSAGYQGLKVSDSNGLQVWSKPLNDGSYAVALLNTNDSGTSTITANWSDVGFASGSASVRDLWEHAEKGSFSGSYTANVPAHGVVMLKVRPNGFEAETGTVFGGAGTNGCGNCSNGQKVGYIGPNGGGFTISNINVPTTGTYTLSVSYTNGDSSRNANISVNGSSAQTVTFPGTGDWNNVGIAMVDVALNAGNNTITINNPSSWAPDFDRIIVSKSPYQRTYEAESGDNTIANGATVKGCGGCAGGKKVGDIGLNGGNVVFRGVNVPRAGVYALTISYGNGDANRDAYLSINGGSAFGVNFSGTGGWDTIGTRTIYVQLNAGNNTLAFSNGSGWAPDFDRIAV